MDFTFSDEQLMVRDLARGILEKEATPERVKAVSAQPDWCDRALWSTLAAAGLLGIAVPDDLGGMGFGIAEACMLLHAVGRVVAPIPALPSVVLGGLAIAHVGTDAQKKEWLVPMLQGIAILTGVAVETRACPPLASARTDGTGWLLGGELRCVPAVHLAQRMVVPAATDRGVGLFLVDPRATGVSLTRHLTSTGEPLCTVRLADVRVEVGDLLGGHADAGAERLQWLADCALVATCAMQVGVCERTVEIATAYVRERVQFGVPIGSFQAVQHRMADCYIDLDAMRWVTWRAAWRLSYGTPAMRETAVAKFWAAEGGARIATAAMHVHGGIGVDVDYAIHRYFLWSKALELSLGGATAQLVRLGQDMARTGPPQLS
ncbi:MAG: acyl-CoA dehydrogenase family protein [Candidatus Binatia bacterium]